MRRQFGLDIEVLSYEETETIKKNCKKKIFLFTAWIEFDGIFFQAMQFQASAPDSGENLNERSKVTLRKTADMNCKLIEVNQ